MLGRLFVPPMFLAFLGGCAPDAVVGSGIARPAVCPVGGCQGAPSTTASQSPACPKPSCARDEVWACTGQALVRWSTARDGSDLRCVSQNLSDACEGGDPHACAFLGRLLIDGRGQGADPRRGLELLARACDDGLALACAVALRASAPDSVAGKPTEGDDAEPSTSRGRFETQLGCLSGVGDACVSSGLSFYAGRDGFPQDRVHAVASYERACRMGAPLGCNNLADALAYGEGTARDVNRAALLFERACRLGEPIGCANLGYMAEHGEGVPRDVARARRLFKAACTSGDVYGCLHAQMLAVSEVNDGAVLAQWTSSCDNDAAPRAAATACAFVGIVYDDGPDGLSRDTEKSQRAMSKACHLRNAYACEWLKVHVEE